MITQRSIPATTELGIVWRGVVPSDRAPGLYRAVAMAARNVRICEQTEALPLLPRALGSPGFGAAVS